MFDYLKIEIFKFYKIKLYDFLCNRDFRGGGDIIEVNK